MRRQRRRLELRLVAGRERRPLRRRAITGGESTENEMFILIGSTYVADGFPQPTSDDPVFGGPASVVPARDASDRSTFRGLALPAAFGCRSAPAHAAHAAHH